ncbi:hypothetical protein RQP53_03670 [Paucibacter sp. APW11]|uniref:MarR family transcriptional regulator n=1 Tax=Roseateles aquae TaxID=3077235 RepID=A0ABU3P740_9BURK|nr:hypothetical protein [Paucibacter sp. APW11]MDT8998372.1 hypothetical protein [Paucibacter sp. APW11]
MIYTPRDGSVADRYLTWLRANPLEELTALEIAQRFGTSSASIPALLASALQSKMLTRQRDAQGNMVYIAGPELARVRPAQAPAAAKEGAVPVLTAATTLTWPAEVPPLDLVIPVMATGKPASKSPTPLLDLNAITVRRGIPAPVTRESIQRAFFKLLDRLDAPSSGADVQSHYRAPLQRAIRQYVAQAPHQDKRFCLLPSDQGKAFFLLYREA